MFNTIRYLLLSFLTYYGLSTWADDVNQPVAARSAVGRFGILEQTFTQQVSYTNPFVRSRRRRALSNPVVASGPSHCFGMEERNGKFVVHRTGSVNGARRSPPTILV